MTSITSMFDQLSDLFDNHDCIITGDFNAKHSAWKDSDATDHNGRELQSSFMNYGFTVINRQVGTRPNLRSANNPLLDIMASNVPDISLSTHTLAPLSDHCPVVATLALQIPTSHLAPQLRQKTNYTRLRHLVEKESFLELITGSDDVEMAWKAWDSHIKSLIDRSSSWYLHQPRKKETVWFTPELYKLKRRQNRLYKAYLRDPQCTVAKSAYCIARNIYKNKLGKPGELR